MVKRNKRLPKEDLEQLEPDEPSRTEEEELRIARRKEAISSRSRNPA